MTDIIATHIDLLRHGQCEGGDIFRGKINVALSASGKDAMFNSVAYHNTQCNTSWASVISSPLRRCLDFSKRYAQEQDIQLVVNTDLEEIDFGDWDGKLVENIALNYPDEMACWHSEPEQFCPPGGEPVRNFKARVVTAFQSIVQDNRGDSVLLVTHGGVIRCILSHAFGLPLGRASILDVPYACISRISIYEYDDSVTTKLTFHNLSAC
ncbi:MAG: histidine phosphatase family protein [Agarilytica sp.]